MQAIRIINGNALAMGTAGLCETFVPNSIYTQCVRWKRKPIWLPTAKSKLFRVPKRYVLPIEETLEIQRLYNNYRTYMTSFMAHLRKIAEEIKVESDMALKEQAEVDDFNACNVINNEWNAEVAKTREIRLVEMREQQRDFIMKRKVELDQWMETKKKELNELVKKAKEESDTFITEDNVDAAIEECLTRVVNYNRALDLEGNWHEGKYPPIPPIEETQKSAAIKQ